MLGKIIEEKYDWDSELGVAYCRIRESLTKKYYEGYAFCHESDLDMKSERTGKEIAYCRAVIKMIEDIKKFRKTEYNTLYDLYKTYKYREKFNEEDVHVKILKKKLYNLKAEIDSYSETLNILNNDLNNYINEKDKFYFIIRKNREFTLENDKQNDTIE